MATRSQTRAEPARGPRWGRWPLRAGRLLSAPARTLPTCVIIGAQKGGTTSLFGYLGEHPDIGTSMFKEVHYFDVAFSRPRLWYRALFPLRGRFTHAIESSPYYLFHPAVPARMRTVIPNAKLIVLLRDPVARAFSHYTHSRAAGQESLSFPEAIAAEESRLRGQEARLLADRRARSAAHMHQSYVQRGIYAPQLRRWSEHFPPEQMLILASEDLFEDPAGTVARVHDWLGLRREPLRDATPSNVGAYDGQLDSSLEMELRRRFAGDRAELESSTGLSFRWG